MKTLIDEFGWNAGKVWNVLHSKGPLKADMLLRNTKLHEDELWAAVGWLARENKICQVNSLYKLGDTNLTSKIGVDAGKVWGTVAKYGEVDISTITKSARIKKVDAYCALGWLARENKVECKKVKQKRTKEPQLKVALK